MKLGCRPLRGAGGFFGRQAGGRSVDEGSPLMAPVLGRAGRLASACFHTHAWREAGPRPDHSSPHGEGRLTQDEETFSKIYGAKAGVSVQVISIDAHRSPTVRGPLLLQYEQRATRTSRSRAR